MKKCNSAPENNAGFSLVEVIVSVGLLALASYYGLTHMGMFQKNITHIEARSNSQVVVSSVIDQVAGNVAIMQSNFDTSEGADTVEELPYAWDDNGLIVPESECEDCEGRVGVMLTPMKGYKGLFLLTIRVGHRNFDEDLVVKRLVLN